MLASHEIETLRRSHAMAPLAPHHVEALLDTCVDLQRRQRELQRLVEELRGPFAVVREALNRLAQLDTAPAEPARRRK